MVSSELEPSSVGEEGENSLAAVPSLFVTRDRFQGRWFFHGPEGEMISGCFLEVGDP